MKEIQPSCELAQRTGDVARVGKGASKGGTAPERTIRVHEMMPALRSAGVRWCVGVRTSRGRLRRDVGAVVMLVFGTTADGAGAGGALALAPAVCGGGGALSSVGSEVGALRRQETQSPLSLKLRQPHSRMVSVR